MVIDCSSIMGKNCFESYSEFYLMLGIARECYRRGGSLNVTGMKIEKDVTPDDLLAYFKYLISIGAIVCEGLNYEGSLAEPRLSFNTKCFEVLGLDNLFREDTDCLFWSYEWAVVAYESQKFSMLVFKNLGNILIHLVGYYMVAKYLGEVSKPLNIEITNRQKVASTFIYINLLSCSKTMENFKDINLNIDFDALRVDLDYSIFYNNGLVAKRINSWSYKEKIQFLEKEEMPVGGVYILWERTGMNPSSPAGRLVNSSIIILDDIIIDYIAYTRVSLSKTHEELIDDYYDIPEDKRDNFRDILNFNPNIQKCTKKLVDLGIRNYMNDEDFFLDKIDPHAMVSKKITIRGVSEVVELSEVDAIYWLLCQFDVPFNRDLYKDMYSPDKELLWDLYNE